MNSSMRLTLDISTSLAPQAATAAANGTGVDLAGCQSALVHVRTGTFTGTTPTAKYKIQESDDNSTFTDVADADLISATTGNASGVAILTDAFAKVDYIGARRYLRIALSAVTGTTPVIPIAGIIIKSHLRHTAGQPV